MALVLGLTGSFGSGKTSVAALFERLGASLVDADRIAAEVVEPGKPALRELAEAFGSQIIGSDGRLRRKLLANVAFREPSRLDRLNAIIHPYVRRRVLQHLEDWKEHPLIVMDIPLLFESGYVDLADKTVVVIINETERFARLGGRGFKSLEIIARLNMQMPQKEKIKRADFVIDNSLDLNHTLSQVLTIVEKLNLKTKLTGEKKKDHESEKQRK